jgi:catechol 2,3-dioxygenase
MRVCRQSRDPNLRFGKSAKRGKYVAMPITKDSSDVIPTEAAWPKVQGPEYATMGPVHLDVIDAERSLRFWRDLVGLHVVSESSGAVELGVAGNPLLVLRPGARRPAQRGYAGLYHVAIHLPNEPEFARVLARLITARHPISPTDHVMSKAIYLHDPDRIMLELTLETPERVRKFEWDEASGQPDIVDSEGRRRGGAEALEVQEVLSALEDGDFARPLPPGTKVGHVHLHVGDLREAAHFYREDLGFIENTNIPFFQMADLYAGGRFPHRIALNTWQGIGVGQAPPGTAGMRHFTIKYAERTRLEGIVKSLSGVESRDDGHVAHDPSGNAVLLTY